MAKQQVLHLTTVGLVVVFVIFAMAAQAAYVSYTICPDSPYTCSGTSCKTFELPEGSCEAAGNSTSHKSQATLCIPNAGLCVEADYFATSDCSGAPQSKNDLVCGQCYPQSGGGYLRPDCFYSNTGKPYLNLTMCSDAGCNACAGTKAVMPAGQCLPNLVHGKLNGYLDIRGYLACSFAYQVQFDTPDCSGPNRSMVIPANTCLEGTRVSCHD